VKNKEKEKNNKKKKNSQLIIRINDEERAEFVDLCETLDTSAAREIRRFIRNFVENNSAS
jgi:transcription elongation GreA/GreB family factor